MSRPTARARTGQDRPGLYQEITDKIIAELEDAVRGGSSARRVETLRQVTDLFLNDGDRLSDDQVQVFDDVLCLLIARVETRAKAELSKRLAPLDYAPFEVIQHLAWDDEIQVAGTLDGGKGYLARPVALGDPAAVARLDVMDRYLLARTRDLAAGVRTQLEAYDVPGATQAVREHLDLAGREVRVRGAGRRRAASRRDRAARA